MGKTKFLAFKKKLVQVARNGGGGGGGNLGNARKKSNFLMGGVP